MFSVRSFGESEVLVETVTDVVAVEQKLRTPALPQRFLHQVRDRRLAEPDRPVSHTVQPRWPLMPSRSRATDRGLVPNNVLRFRSVMTLPAAVLKK